MSLGKSIIKLTKSSDFLLQKKDPQTKSQHLVLLCSDCIRRKQSHIAEDLDSPWFRLPVCLNGMKEPLSRIRGMQTGQNYWMCCVFLVSNLPIPQVSVLLLLKVSGVTIHQQGTHVTEMYRILFHAYQCYSSQGESVVSILSTNACLHFPFPQMPARPMTH